MGNVHSEIKERLREICGQSLLMWVATVQEVSGDVCAVTIDGTRFTGVRLCAVSDASSTKLVVKPKQGSKVIVADLSAGRLTDLIVLKCSEVESITINGGELGGMVKIEELKRYLNALKTAIEEGFSSIGVGTAANGETGETAFKTSMASATLDNLEDDKVKH